LQLSTLSKGVGGDMARDTYKITSPMRVLSCGFGVAKYIPSTVAVVGFKSLSLQIPSADFTRCRRPLQTSIADSGCTHDLADLLSRRSSPSNYSFSALALSGGGGFCTRDSCTCANSLMHRLGVIDIAVAEQCFICPGLSFSALALSGGGGACTRDACACAYSLMHHLGV